MDNFIEDLKQSWQQEKATPAPEVNVQDLVKKAAAYQRNSLRFQWSNVIILTVTLLLYILFFHQFLLYGTVLSKFGFLIMAVPLAIRIAAEVLSIAKGRSIAWDANAKDHTAQLIHYTGFRKWMHGTLTYVVMALYTLGYYCIMIQMGQMIPGWLTILLSAAYPVVAVIIILQVRKGIRREMDTLQWLSGLGQQMEKTEP